MTSIWFIQIYKKTFQIVYQKKNISSFSGYFNIFNKIYYKLAPHDGIADPFPDEQTVAN
jgi:hypothetical protein